MNTANPGDGPAPAGCREGPQPGAGEGAARQGPPGQDMRSRAGSCCFCSQLEPQGLHTVGAQYLLLERLLTLWDRGLMDGSDG